MWILKENNIKATKKPPAKKEKKRPFSKDISMVRSKLTTGLIVYLLFLLLGSKFAEQINDFSRAIGKSSVSHHLIHLYSTSQSQLDVICAV